MKKLFTCMLILGNLFSEANAQVWQTVLTDGYEYTTVCPDIIPGTVWHYTPQNFAVHSGNTSLYLNFQDCNGGTGTCTGELVYRRGFSTCRNQPLRFSTWLTTSFSGTQCNVRIEIKDGNGTVLDNQTSIPADYAPSWTQYQSATVTPATDSVYFLMYTNVGGSPGNDLSMDDFMLEKTDGNQNSTVTGNICTSAVSTNLYSQIPAMSDSTGTWSGPSNLTGGYLGTYTNGLNIIGTYVYENHGFGMLPGCPMAYDSVVVTMIPPPTVNLGSDTTLCTNQSILLNAGNAPGNTYLWSNGVTGPNVLAFTSSSVNVTNTYSVQVTNTVGCINHDTISVNFVVCTGIEDLAENDIVVYPNPSNGTVYMTNNFSGTESITYDVVNAMGQNIATGILNNEPREISMPGTANGIYSILFMENSRVLKTVRLVINR